MSAEYQLNLTAKTLETAEPDQKTVLDKAKANLGFIPNMYAGMVNSPGLLDTYLVGYKYFREHSGFNPAEQEVVFLTISHENGCHYCMAAHSTIADKMSNVPAEITDAIRSGQPIPDPKLAALSEFTRTMVIERGKPATRDVDRFLSAGYSERHILELILAIAVKTLSNYSNHLFHTEVDEMFADRSWKAGSD